MFSAIASKFDPRPEIRIPSASPVLHARPAALVGDHFSDAEYRFAELAEHLLRAGRAAAGTARIIPAPS
jgi:hypothetical protein